MTRKPLDLDREVSAAIRHFWTVRGAQQSQQGSRTGRKDSGNRSAVTGGKHGDGFIELLAAILKQAGIPDAEIHARQRTLPSYFRPSKDWDLIVKAGDDLVAVIEIKSHVGSFGNNFNNRVEEALGSATDFWAAYGRATFKPSARPWLGYLMMLEDAPRSTRSGRAKVLPHYSIRPEFESVSYARRYEIFCERLVRERLYDASCLLMSNAERGLKGHFSEPSEELSFRRFAISLTARAAAFNQLR